MGCQRDDRQSIYAFRGANIQNILRFTEQFPDAKIYNLTRNYRSQGVIVEAAEEVIKHNPEQLKKECYAVKPQGDLIHIYCGWDDEEEAEWVARTIDDLVERSGYSYSDIAILYRMNFVSRQFEAKLMAHKIPYRVISGLHFYGRKEIRDLLAMIRIAVNPQDDAAAHRLLGLLPGIGDASIDAYTVNAAEKKISLVESLASLRVRNARARAQAAFLLGFIEQAQVMIAALSLDVFLEKAIELFGYMPILEKECKDNPEDLMNRKQNIQELLRVAASIQETERGLMAAAKLLELAMQSDEQQGNDGVQLMTIHASKGLEFPVVFLVAFNEGIIPARPSDASEERRLAYVGMTRAKDKLYITHAANRMQRGYYDTFNPSPFLRDIPDRLVRFEH